MHLKALYTIQKWNFIPYVGFSGYNSNLCWNRQACWPALYLNQVGSKLEPPRGKGIFIPLPWSRHQPPLWDCSDLCLLSSRCKSEHAAAAWIGVMQPGTGVWIWPNAHFSVPPPYLGCLARWNVPLYPCPEMSPSWPKFVCMELTFPSILVAVLGQQSSLQWPSDSCASAHVLYSMCAKALGWHKWLASAHGGGSIGLLDCNPKRMYLEVSSRKKKKRGFQLNMYGIVLLFWFQELYAHGTFLFVLALVEAWQFWRSWLQNKPVDPYTTLWYTTLWAPVTSANLTFTFPAVTGPNPVYLTLSGPS